MYNTRPFIGINYILPWTYAISALRILPTVPQHLSTVSIPHFTFHIPQFHILPTAYSITQVKYYKQKNRKICLFNAFPENI